MSKPNTHTVKTVCQYCGVGCGMQLHVAHNRVVKVNGDPTHPANFGRLCTKGLTCADVLTAPGRLDAAFVRSGRTHALSRTDLDEAEVWAWLQDGAFVYVCGDARRMAKDVDLTLHLVARQHGNLSEDNAAAYVQQLTREKRYLRDVY